MRGVGLHKIRRILQKKICHALHGLYVISKRHRMGFTSCARDPPPLKQEP